MYGTVARSKVKPGTELANSPEQDARFRKLLELLEGEPKWHDGEIVHAYRVSRGAGGLDAQVASFP